MSRVKKAKRRSRGISSAITWDIAIAIGAALIAIAWVGFGNLDLAAPLRIRDDFVFVLFNVKSLLEYGTIYTNAAVAFPEQGQYMAFPTPDILQYYLIRFLGLFTDNIFTVLNTFIATSFTAAAISSYFALRYTHISRWLSFCGALIFACSAYMCHRASLHPYFCFSIIMPWVCRFCLLQFYQHTRLGQPRVKIKIYHNILLGILVGSTGLYYAFFSAFFICVTLMLLLINQQPLAKLKAGITLLCSLLITFNLRLLPNYLNLIGNSVAFPKRNYFEQVIYGLRQGVALLPYGWLL